MKKRLCSLLIYTIVVIGGAFLFRKEARFDSILYMLTAFSFLVSGLLLFTGNTNQTYRITDIKEEKENKEVKNMTFLSFITAIYIFVPFLLAIYLFAN